ncbi:MAG: hypothetical protein HKL86_02325 [Acidimicrobiaceae bacterium]|nr:hypothetical protein [Acidimicrobiaceae bacterium]
MPSLSKSSSKGVWTGLRASRRFDRGVVLLLLGIALWLTTTIRADFVKMGQYGLVSIVGWTYFVGLSMVVVGFSLELFRTPMRSKFLLAFVIVFVIYIYGTASAIEPVASLGDSWIHAGFVQYIFQHGSALNNYDARFSWPGGFSMAALLVSFAGQQNALFMLRWFPLFIELMYLAPLLVIGRSSGVGRRTAWLGTILFFASNWIYQDYFSPQALANLFLLVVLATVLSSWRPRSLKRIPQNAQLSQAVKERDDTPSFLARIGGHDTFPVWRAFEADGLVSATWERRQASRLRTFRDGVLERLRQTRTIMTIGRLEGHDTLDIRKSNQVLGLMALLTTISLALAMSHQLTPYALVVMLLGALLTRKLGRPELIFIVALFAIAWLSLGASNFWVGHLSMIFGSVGQIGSTVGSNVTGRIVGSQSHRIIVNLRILITLVIYLLAGIGVLRRSTDSRVLEVLTGAPILLLAAQSYGGEGLMRVVLYGLPFAAILAASSIVPLRFGDIKAAVPIFPNLKHQRVILTSCVATVLLLIAVLTTIVRGGNDSYESFSTGEVAAVNYVYQHARNGQSVSSIVSYLPSGQRDVGLIAIGSISATGDSPPLSYFVTQFVRLRPTWIILSRAQEAWGEILVGYPKGWINQVQQGLLGKGYVIAAHWSTAAVLKYSKP